MQLKRKMRAGELSTKKTEKKGSENDENRRKDAAIITLQNLWDYGPFNSTMAPCFLEAFSFLVTNI